MKFRPILYNQFSAKANAEGRKTQTRRETGLKKINQEPGKWHPCRAGHENGVMWVEFKHENGTIERIKCPYGKVGDGLWGRENFSITEKANSSTKPLFGTPNTKNGNHRYLCQKPRAANGNVLQACAWSD